MKAQKHKPNRFPYFFPILLTYQILNSRPNLSCSIPFQPDLCSAGYYLGRYPSVLQRLQFRMVWKRPAFSIIFCDILWSVIFFGIEIRRNILLSVWTLKFSFHGILAFLVDFSEEEKEETMTKRCNQRYYERNGGGAGGGGARDPSDNEFIDSDLGKWDES